jgi:putative tryptophan/tyrosine transport system substrate-binding protein
LEDVTMPRRTIRLMLTLALAMLFAPLVAEAQQTGKVWRIGFLSPAFPPPAEPSRTRIEAFRQGLRALGWIEGQNLVIEYRWGAGKRERLAALAADLVGLKVDVIVAATTAGVLAAKQATGTIPIVMAHVADALAIGVVQSLARPGGNVTGQTLITADLVGKQVQLLKEALPRLSRLAVVHPKLTAVAVPYVPVMLRELQAAAQALGMTIQLLDVETLDDWDNAFKAMVREHADALYMVLYDDFIPHRTRIAELAVSHQLPTIFPYREFVEAGGLMSYAVDFPDQNRRAATYVDKILKSTKPADLPVEQPMKFELVINLKTAKALGLTIPPSILFQADEVIQ